jgi:integrase
MKLAIGWNPVIDVQAPRSATPLREAMDLFLETKLREQLRPDSERTYRSLLGILAAWLNEQGKLMMAAGTFTEDDAIAFMDRCFAARKISGRTFNNYRGFYGTLCSWLKKHKYMRENPFDMVERKRYDKRRKNRRVLTDDERQRVRVYLQEHQPRFLVFSLLMFHCALRPKEVFYLMPRHFDLERQCITVEASFSKTHYERVVAIPNVLVPELRSLGLDEQDPNDHIFSKGMLPGPALKRSTYSGKFWKRLRDDLGLPAECKHYSLRDTAVLQLARDQVSRLDSMNHFDHHSSDMHDIYGRAREDHGNDEVRQKMSAF